MTQYKQTFLQIWKNKFHVKKLSQPYCDILHFDGQKHIFTNQIKHPNRTTDEILACSKKYTYPFVHKEKVHKQVDDSSSLDDLQFEWYQNKPMPVKKKGE